LSTEYWLTRTFVDPDLRSSRTRVTYSVCVYIYIVVYIYIRPNHNLLP
jgi:hypothetical protein